MRVGPDEKAGAVRAPRSRPGGAQSSMATQLAGREIGDAQPVALGTVEGAVPQGKEATVG